MTPASKQSVGGGERLERKDITIKPEMTPGRHIKAKTCI